ncbi:hypothetical protein M3J09_006422 [Ascochyta lentis]
MRTCHLISFLHLLRHLEYITSDILPALPWQHLSFCASENVFFSMGHQLDKAKKAKSLCYRVYKPGGGKLHCTLCR